MRLNEDWRQFIASLNSHNVEYVVAGALAVAFHGHPRFTGDLDILVRATPENAARAVEAIRDFGFGSLGIAVNDLTQPGQVVQLGFAPRRIDILTSLTGVTFQDAWESRVAANLDGLPVAYLGKQTLIKNKRATGRLQDLADIEALGSE